MRLKNIHIGTSGWSYSSWRKDFYPDDVKSSDWLTFYSKHFDITEINNSFYHLPRKTTVLNWAAKVPKRFKFCPKISKYLTHIKRLSEPEEPLQRFFEVFEPIKKLLGPVLVQLPPSMKFDHERAEYFFKILQKDYADYQFALEIRHKSWLENESLDLMTRYNIALVISQSGKRFPYSEIVTSKNIYVRFHGPEKLYASSYSDEMLQYFAKKFKQWRKEGHVIWAFFNNTMQDYALNNANRLIEFIGK